MELRVAVVADEAHTDRQGKVTITGIFHRVQAATFPAQHLKAALVFLFDAGPWDLGARELRVDFVDEDAELLLRFEVQMDVDISGGSMPGAVILPIPSIPLPKPGQYTFEAFLDGQHRASIPLDAMLRPSGQSA